VKVENNWEQNTKDLMLKKKRTQTERKKRNWIYNTRLMSMAQQHNIYVPWGKANIEREKKIDS